MQHRHCFIKRGFPQRRLMTAALCVAVVVLFAGSTASAQSGRRVPKRTPASPVPEAETKSIPAPTVAKADSAQFSLYVCTGPRNPFDNIPYFLADTVRNIFVQRLSEASSIKVLTGGEAQRGAAIKRAKNEEHTYVVLLELETDQDQRSATANIDYSRLSIRYSVFAPVTGKTKTDGRVYQQQYRVGRGGIGFPSPRRDNTGYSDYLIKEAARQAADRVLAEFRYVPPRAPVNKNR